MTIPEKNTAMDVAMIEQGQKRKQEAYDKANLAALENKKEPPKRYCCGFVFTPDMEWICLIMKQRPKWMKGKLNGIGGLLIQGEGGKTGMSREFLEEGGIDIHPNAWQPLCMLHDGEYRTKIFFYWAKVDHNLFGQIKTQTDEKIYVFQIINLHYTSCVDNLKWLIPLAIYMHDNPKDQIEI